MAEKLRPLSMLGTGLSFIEDHALSCDYAKVVLPRIAETQPDSPIPETMCFFGRTGRCALADIALKQAFDLDVPRPHIRVLEMPKE